MTKKFVIPGELVTVERKRLGSNVFLREGKIYSNSLGFVQETDTVASVVALKGVYMPTPGDVVVGIVSGEKFSVYEIDFGSFFPSFVSKKEFREEVPVNSFVSAKIMKVSELNEADLANVRVLFGGEVFDVMPVKVPRVIGRNGSMLDVLKRGTGANFFVGRNGKIWVKGGNIELFKQAVRMIESKSHEENLTNVMGKFLNIEPRQELMQEQQLEVEQKGE